MGCGDGEHAARFHGRRDQALLDELGLDRVGGVGERRLECVGIGYQRPVVRLVRAVARVGVLLVGDGVVDRRDGRERVVLDVDHLGGVGRLVARLRQHDRDDLAEVVDLVGGHREVLGVDHVLGDRPRTRQRRDPEAHVLELRPGVDGEDAVHVLGGRGVDVLDAGVGEGRPHHAHPELTGHLDVVDVLAFTGEQRRVLPTLHRLADIPLGVLLEGRVLDRGHDATSCPEAVRTARTMLW